MFSSLGLVCLFLFGTCCSLALVVDDDADGALEAADFNVVIKLVLMTPWMTLLIVIHSVINTSSLIIGNIKISTEAQEAKKPQG